MEGWVMKTISCGSDIRKKPDILRSKGGGELTPVEVPWSSDLTIFVTWERLVERLPSETFENRVIDS